MINLNDNKSIILNLKRRLDDIRGSLWIRR
jgi:hypothetical protein